MCACTCLCVCKGNSQTFQQLLSVNAVGLTRDRLCHTGLFVCLFSFFMRELRAEGLFLCQGNKKPDKDQAKANLDSFL